MNQLTQESLIFWSAFRPEKPAEYLATASLAYRDDLIDVLAHFAPFESVLEIGCNSGPNYDRLVAAFGKQNYTGLDINKEALNHFHTRMPDVKFIYGSILESVPSAKFDLVFTSSILSLIAPEDVMLAIHNIANLSSRLIVIQEPKIEKHNGIFHQWNHDYLNLFDDYPEFKWSEINGIIIGNRLDRASIV